MARPKKDTSTEEVQEETTETTEETQVANEVEETTAPKSSKKTVILVQYNAGVREFSKEIHGNDFEDLAKSFAKKFNGTIV